MEPSMIDIRSTLRRVMICEHHITFDGSNTPWRAFVTPSKQQYSSHLFFPYGEDVLNVYAFKGIQSVLLTSLENSPLADPLHFW